MTDQGRPAHPSASVEFEVLMEFQRHVKNRFDQSRILWFNAAVTALAKRQNSTPNDVMKKALVDFEQFVALVEKNIGPVPSGQSGQGPGTGSGDDELEEFDRILNNE